MEISLTEAFANTIFGNVNKSNEILGMLINRTRNQKMDTELLSEWNLVNIINRVMSGEKQGLKSDLFELAIFTNNINEHFVKNIIKLILGYVLKEDGNTQKALEIFNEEITYFAKEKVAIGAMLSWLLIVQITLDMGDMDSAMDTAVKSLEIAESPKINNFIFQIYFNKYIAEIYLKKGDFTAAKMYLEKAVVIAKNNGLKYQLISLYDAYGDYLWEIMKKSKNYGANNIDLTNDMYDKAIEIAKELQLKNVTDKAIKCKNEFKTFCQLNSLV